VNGNVQSLTSDSDQERSVVECFLLLTRLHPSEEEEEVEKKEQEVD
jgi:hypothetical protein